MTSSTETKKEIVRKHEHFRNVLVHVRSTCECSKCCSSFEKNKKLWISRGIK